MAKKNQKKSRKGGVCEMGRKDNYSYRLSKNAVAYLKYCADNAKLSESKFLDFLLCSLSANDEFYKQYLYENKKTDSND